METGTVTYRKDYSPPAYLIPEIILEIILHDTRTVVKSLMTVVRNPDAPESGNDIVLNGEKVEFCSAAMNGTVLDESAFILDDKTLTILNVPDSFTIQITTEINPLGNRALEGLYKSGTVFCTQNEPEGFRRITYFIDRPDVLSRFTTLIEGDIASCPVMLSNGNCVKSEVLDNGRHRITWEDPFPKPAYLFALVAGDLGLLQDGFITRSGRSIDLRIYCDRGNEDKCRHAMDSLKKAMKWDEDRFGLEYDLDIYMIVAVDAFNMGAMENKGLNVFNSQYILADPETATDSNYMNIERVVGHEYFHNWTGNRVTCRDWFQLTLKEGLTVFRDQEFVADTQTRPVKRIEDVSNLRSFQFPEDEGPNAHPVRPDSYIEINNFYTVTVYEKGSAIIRMIHTILGEGAFQRGMKEYFARNDGKAVSCDDFIAAMEKGGDVDLNQFMLWYSQAGTPVLTVTSDYDDSRGAMRIDIRQQVPDTPGQNNKQPMHIPFHLGIVGAAGNDIPVDASGNSTLRLELKKEHETVEIQGLAEKPVLSLNRGFSAPVKVRYDYSLDELLFLMRHDSDYFNRWDAGQTAACRIINNILDEKHDDAIEKYIDSLRGIIDDDSFDLRYKTLLMQLPQEAVLFQDRNPVDVDGLCGSRKYMKQRIASALQEVFLDQYNAMECVRDYDISMESIGLRIYRLMCLEYYCETDNEDAADICSRHYRHASNMTDEIGALAILTQMESDIRSECLKHFYDKWKDNQLVMIKWFAVHAASRLPGTIEEVRRLEKDPLFDITIPNIVRALVGTLCQNSVIFHDKSGEGYRYCADKIVEIDSFNPSIASVLAKNFKLFRKLDRGRQELIEIHLRRILGEPDLSKNTYEIVWKTIGE
ncbi:MAG TPA: aminopeptidase N [Spirochaetota bacterium]|nr:aminopeptidase N [Spirochaetota bacterium]